MSSEIKNTLYRFVSFRAPKPLKKATLTKFVVHPNLTSTSNVYLKAVSSIPASKTKKQHIADTTTGYVATSYKSTTDVKTAVGTAFYDFAEWLAANRTTLTISQVSSFLPLSALSTETLRLQLWDNLFYQICTYKSNYVREALLSVLVADLFLQQRTTIAQTDGAYRKLAQARVAIPSELFGIVPTASLEVLTQAELDKIPVSVNHLQADMDKTLAGIRIAKYEKFIEEIKTAQATYDKTNLTAYEAARISFDTSVKAAYDAASYTDQTYTDPILGITKKYRDYTNLKLPDFSYTPKAELDTTVLSASLSAELYALLQSYITNKKVSTFAEVLDILTAAIRQDYGVAFAKSNLKSRSAAKTASRSSFSTTGAMDMLSRPVVSISSTAVAGNKTGFALVFEGLPDGVEIVGASYQITKNGGTAKSYTGDYTTSYSTARTILNIAESDPMATDSATDVSISGTLTYSDGSGATFTGSTKPNTSANTSGSVRPGFTGSGTVTPKPLVLKDANGNAIKGTDKMIDYIPTSFGIKRLGIADYRKVEQEVCCYVPGEVSHIENIMAREYKEKSARRLRRTENTTTTSSERESEQLTDTTSTDRFEMNREVASVIAESKSVGAHASFSAQWGSKAAGPSFGTQVGADFAYNTSSEESDSQSVTEAKEITERALERVVQKVKEERISKVIEEYEENNKHGFDNRKGDNHISGVYRWVDKIFKNQIVNYGKRVMYEFMIPEPAAFHNEAMSIALNAPIKPEPPVDPRAGEGIHKLGDHKSLTATNYEYWAAIYGAEVQPAPAATMYIGKTFGDAVVGDGETMKESTDLEIPEGYYTKEVTYDYSVIYDKDSGQAHGFALTVGNVKVDYNTRADKLFSTATTTTKTLNRYYNSIHVGYSALNYQNVHVTASIKLELSTEAFEKWQLLTFNAIIAAYQDCLADYNQKVADLNTATEQVLSANPLFYRQIENTSLRKNCISYLMGHENMGLDMLNGRDDLGVTAKYNESTLESYAAKVKFMEQAFEWELMSYNFYPFYWAKKSQWQQMYVTDNQDALFRSFLQSGMARVILTVRPGFEEAVNWYMSTGQIWNGGKAPVLNDTLFLSIVDELQDIGGFVEDTWESRVPTTLTVIQAGTIGLNVEGLPCNPDCDEYKIFDANGNVTGTLPNPITQTNKRIGDAEETA
jgi:hypothetical protein